MTQSYITSIMSWWTESINCSIRKKESEMMNHKKAVYFICNHKEGHVSFHVWDILQEKGYLREKTGIVFAGQEVMKYTDAAENEFYFVPTDIPICLDYQRFLADMIKYFNNFDISGMVTWHEGNNAPTNVFSVHTLGDVNSGVFGAAKPRYMRNLMMALNRNKNNYGMDDYRVVTEATHWSGVHAGKGDPNLLTKFPVAMMDIEIGSDESSWSNDAACEVLTLSLLDIFSDDGKVVHNLLCVGGVHFETSFADAVFLEGEQNEVLGITHIIANQWLVSGNYEDESGFQRACNCIKSIDGGIEAIAFHDKLKGCYKDLVRKLGQQFQIPIYKHQKLRNYADLKF